MTKCRGSSASQSISSASSRSRTSADRFEPIGYAWTAKQHGYEFHDEACVEHSASQRRLCSSPALWRQRRGGGLAITRRNRLKASSRCCPSTVREAVKPTSG